MTDSSKWVAAKVRLGYILLGAGIGAFAVGAALERWGGDLPFDARILSGLGIFLLGVGAARLVVYRMMRGDRQAAKRQMVEERDERSVMLRNQAGNRAFWVSLALGYVGLMWSSFASNGQLPVLEGDVLWFFLVALVVIPFVVYLATYLLGLNRD